MVTWELAVRLRSFAAAINAASLGDDLSSPSTICMADEARALADRIDPLTPDNEPNPATMDYIKFKDWYGRTLAYSRAFIACCNRLASRVLVPLRGLLKARA